MGLATLLAAVVPALRSWWWPSAAGDVSLQRGAAGPRWIRGRGPAAPRWFTGVLVAALAVTLAFLVLPVLAIFLEVPPGELLASLGDPAATDALRLSVETTLSALAIIVVGGIDGIGCFLDVELASNVSRIQYDDAFVRPYC